MIYDLDGMLPERAFQRDARGQIKPQSGGPSGAPANQNVTTTSIPEYARPYVEKSLGQAAALTDINQNPYKPYGGQQVAAFSPLQAQAMGSVSNQQVSPQFAEGSNLASQAGQYALQAPNQARQLQAASLGYGAQGAQLGVEGGGMYGALGAQYGNLGSQYGGLGSQYGAQGMQYGARGSDIGSLGVLASRQGFGAGAQYAGQATDPGAVGAYMSPYMQNAVDVQKQEAIRDYQKTAPAMGAQAVRSGAFGGSRQAIVEAEAQRNINQQLANIQAAGSQQAYDRAMQSMQFGSNLGLQGLQAGYQGLQTGMQGTAQGIQGAQAGMQGAGLGIQGAQAGMQGASIGLQGVNTQLAGTAQGLQSVQGAVGAGQYGLSGLGAANQAASTLGQLGQTQFGQNMAITDAQMRAGAMQQAQEQKGLDIMQQQYADSLNYPYKQLGFMSDIYRGLPMSQSSQSMYQNPSAISQAAGLGTAAYGLYQMSKKNGGVIKMADGGITQLFDVGGEVKSDLYEMSPEDLQAYIKKSSSATAKKMAMQILAEKQFQERQQGSGVTALPSNLPVGGMAGGGIIAFADEGQVVDPNAPVVPPAAVSKYGGIEAISPEGRAKFAEYEGLLKDLRGKGGSEREQAKNMAIFQAGLGMMGGTSPNAFANIAAGAMPAVTQYQSALKDIRKEDRDTLKQMLDLGVSKEQFRQKAQQMGIDVYKADRAYDATIRAASMRTAGEKTPSNERQFVKDYIAKARASGDTTTPDAVLAVQGAERYVGLLGAAGQRAETGQQKVEDASQTATLRLINDARTNVDNRLTKDFNSLENRTIRDLRKKDRKNGTNTAAEYKQSLYDAEVAAIRKVAETSRNSGGAGAGGTGANPPPAGANPPPAGANPPPAGGSANIPPAAVEMLRGDPSPERRRLFDATFGAGASDRVLQ